MDNFDQLFPDNRHTGSTTLQQAKLVMLRILCVVDYICRKHQIPYWLCSGTLLGAVRHQGFIPWDDDLDISMLREDYERFQKIALEELPADMFLQTKENEPSYEDFTAPCKIRDTKSQLFCSYLEKKTYHKGIFIDIFPFDRFHPTGFQRRKEVSLKRMKDILCKCFNAEVGKDTSMAKTVLSWFQPVFRLMLIGHRHVVEPIIKKNRTLPDDLCFVGHGFDTPWLRNLRLEDIFPLQELTFENHRFFAPHNTDAYLKRLYGDTYMTPPPEKERVQRHSTTIKPII